MAGESLYQGEPDFMKKKKKPGTTDTSAGSGGDAGAGKQGKVAMVMEGLQGMFGKTDVSKTFEPPDKITKGTGSQALIAKIREKRANNPVDTYLANKRKKEEENRFA